MMESGTTSRRRWTRSEYHRMGEAGVLREDERVELLDGETVKMTPQNSRHAAGIRLVEIPLQAIAGPECDVRCQLPLALSEDSEPEPDVALLSGSARDDVDEHPSTALLVVEVADTSLSLDRGPKQRVYPAAGAPEYWILDLIDGWTLDYRPERPPHRRRQRPGSGDRGSRPGRRNGGITW